MASFIIVGCLLRCGDEGTGVESEMRQTGAIGAHGSDACWDAWPWASGSPARMIVFSVLFAVLVANLTSSWSCKAPSTRACRRTTTPSPRKRASSAGTISTYDGTVLATLGTPGGRHLRARVPGWRAGGAHRGLHFPALRHRRHRGRLQRHPAAASRTSPAGPTCELARGHPDRATTSCSPSTPRIQQAAQDALAGQVGAAVVMDPETGAVLALASSPTYDAAHFEELLTQRLRTAARLLRAVQPRHPGAVRARLHVQDGHPGHRAAGRRGHGGHGVRLPRRPWTSATRRCPT